MFLIYITGTPGTGKTAVRDELRHRGYTAYDTDEDGFAHYYNTETNEPVQGHVPAEARTAAWRKTYAWKVPRSAVEKLRAEATHKPVFLSGVVANDVDELWDLFDIVFSLTIDEATLRHRITARTTGDYGKNEHEFASLLAWQKTAATDYKKLGAIMIDATRPIEQVVDDILAKTTNSPKENTLNYHTIAIDCDDVLVETAPLILDHYNKTYGTQLELKDMYSKDLNVWGVSDVATAIERVEGYLKTDEYRNAPPLQEAIAATKHLAKHYELHIVTGRTEFLAVATQAMLDQYFSGVFQSIEFTGFFGDKARSKADVCRDLGADLLIDDHLHHVKQVAESGIDVLLFGEYPWNQTAEDLPGNVRRVSDWEAVTGLLLSEEQE
jgi:broad-specificity NMP kinase/5'(3')-deoxyribonucleotidase